MKKIVSIAIIAIMSLGIGYYLFSISPQSQTNSVDEFNLENLKPTNKIREIQANDHVLGNKEAKNIMVVYEDIQCPACKNFEPVLKSIPSELKDTKLIFRHYPLTTIHKNAASAAFASEAASSQGKFWEWISLAYEKQEEWQSEKDPLEKFVLIAKEAGVSDIEKFKTDYGNKTYKTKVEEDVREATALGISGTPTLYFNNVKLQISGIENIKKQVEKLYK